MHRTQIDILDVHPGQAIGTPILSIAETEILIPVGKEHFAIIGAEESDGDGYIDTSVSKVKFHHHYYKLDDLRKVFDGEQIAQFEAEQTAKLAARAERERKIEYERYLALKSRFEPQS